MVEKVIFASHILFDFQAGGKKHIVILLCLLFGPLDPIPFKFYTGRTDKTGYAMLAAALIIYLGILDIEVASFTVDGLPAQTTALDPDDDEGFTKYLKHPELLNGFDLFSEFFLFCFFVLFKLLFPFFLGCSCSSVFQMALNGKMQKVQV
jgi:hypothetical protein